MNGQEILHEVAALRHSLHSNGRLRLEFLASLSKLLREYGVNANDELLGSLVVAVPAELSSEAVAPMPPLAPELTKRSAAPMPPVAPMPPIAPMPPVAPMPPLAPDLMTRTTAPMPPEAPMPPVAPMPPLAPQMLAIDA